MRHLTRVLCVSAAVLSLTACGPRITSTGPRSTTTSTRDGQSSLFPVTITRTGGIAGFRDTLVVSGDGLVLITRKAQARRQCHLSPEAAERLRTAASQLPRPRATAIRTSPSFPDDMVTTVQLPKGGPVRLEDQGVADRNQVFHELLNDLDGGGSASHICTPV